MRAYSYACNSRPAGSIEYPAAIVHDEIVTFPASQAEEVMMKMAMEHSGSVRVVFVLHSRAVEDRHFSARDR